MQEHTLRLFSPLRDGTAESWQWLCHVTNGRDANPACLSQDQRNWAHEHGYLPEGA